MLRRSIRVVLLGIGALVSATAFAQPVTLEVSDSHNLFPMPVVVTVGPAVVPVMIPPNTPATIKRDLIRNALNAAGIPAVNGPTPASVVVQNANHQNVALNTGGTCELQDSIKGLSSSGGTAGFPGHFEPMAGQNLPAIFSAGIVTDVGMLNVQVSAAELNFQTDGPIICQALFQRLAPRAPQYGAQINYAGDRLEVYFDPAYTVTQGGIIFGTNSPSQQGCLGTLILPPPPPPCPGDFNGDGVVSPQDLFDFLAAFFQNNPRADVNQDGRVSPQDLFDYLASFFRNCR